MREAYEWFDSRYPSDGSRWYLKIPRDALWRRQKRLKRIAQVIKVRSGCVACGYNKTASGLDFDHLPGHWKIFNVSSPPENVRVSEFKEEIAKCQVLCATCHRETTQDRRRKTKRKDDPWVWFRTALNDEQRKAEIARRLSRSMIIPPEEATELAAVFLSLRDVIESFAGTNEDNDLYLRLCRAIVAGGEK